MTTLTARVPAEAAPGPSGGPALRLPGTDKPGVYKPAHEGRYVASWGSRSCGVCGVHRPLQGGKWKRHPVRGWVADCCNGRGVAVPAVGGVA